MAEAGWVLATYRLVDRPDALPARAEGIAVGLTVGSWTDLPAARQEAVRRHCGRVESVRTLGDAADGRVIAEVMIAYPEANFTDTFSSILTTTFGKLSMDGEIRLVRLELPQSLRARLPGPRFGVGGVREWTGVHGRPLLMSIFKACVGRGLPELTEQFRAQALGGADLVKDDEIFFNESYASPEERVRAYGEAARQVEAETGCRVRYAVLLSGPAHRLLERARRLCALGAGALLCNALTYGYDVLADLAADPEVTAPLLCHPALAGALYGSETHGIAAPIVLGDLLRLAGADIVIYPSPYGSVTLGRQDGAALVEALRRPGSHRPAMPAPSAGIFPGLVGRLVADLGPDCIVNAGGAIHGHPGGATAGGLAFRAAIDAVMAGTPLPEAAAAVPALAQALDRWGRGT